MKEEKTWFSELLEAKQNKELDPTIEVGFQEDRYKDGWLKERNYTSADEVIKDIAYIVYEYARDEKLNSADLDMYFYKREYLQKKLDEFYADEYVLVDRFCKPQKRFKYGRPAEEIITKLASDLDCYVVLRKGDKYFAEVGDNIVDLGETPDIFKLEDNGG